MLDSNIPTVMKPSELSSTFNVILCGQSYACPRVWRHIEIQDSEEATSGQRWILVDIVVSELRREAFGNRFHMQPLRPIRTLSHNGMKYWSTARVRLCRFCVFKWIQNCLWIMWLCPAWNQHAVFHAGHFSEDMWLSSDKSVPSN